MEYSRYAPLKKIAVQGELEHFQNNTECRLTQFVRKIS